MTVTPTHEVDLTLQAIAAAFHELATNAVKYGALATRSGRIKVSWRVDERVGGPRLTVTGIGLNPFQTNDDAWNQTIFARPDSAAVESTSAGNIVGYEWRVVQYNGISYIATFAEGTDVDALWPALAAEGIAMTPREAYLDPERYSDRRNDIYVSPEILAAAGLVALIVGLGLLEVILLAGAAFAVSARRQVRDLGLVSANGGTSQHVRRIMYAQGFVLGVLGAVLGLAVGAALTLGGKPLWERTSGSLIEGWHFGPAELAIAAGVGVISGLAAAFVPARGAARMQPIEALAQRFRATPLTAHLPRLGLVLIAVGAGGGLVASRIAAAQLADYADAIEAAAGTGQWVSSPPMTEPYIALQLLGAVVAVVGLILTISFLITVLARRMRRWPLSVRYAARDAARHRHRTTPAVAAIMIVVASATRLSIGLAGAERVEQLTYQPVLPANVMSVTPDGPAADDFTAHLLVIAGALPSARVIESSVPGTAMDDGVHSWFEQVYVSPPDPWDAWAEENCTPVDDGFECGDEVFDGEDQELYEHAEVAIATPELMEFVHGRTPDAETLVALESGALIIPSAGLADADGNVVFEIYEWEFDGFGGGTGDVIDHVVLPADVMEVDGPGYGSLPGAFISETAAAQHWEIHTTTAFIQYDESATADQLDAARDIAESLGLWTHTEDGPNSMAIVYLILAAGAGFVTLVGVGVTVALAAAEGRADLATMSAVGAPPRRRRAIAGWQALVVGGLGTALGLALGAYFAYLVWPAIGAPDYVVPWRSIGLIGLAVPLLAALFAVIFTRSRLPMVRRIE
jgi:putative ABC transport system permease protein